MPKLVRLYIESVGLGFLISAAFTAGLLWLDIAGIGHLVLGSDIGWIAAVMLVLSFVMLFLINLIQAWSRRRYGYGA